eukprot:1508934-Prymnesium_polylepis.1
MDALDGKVQGGYSRVIAPDGRDIAAAPEGRGEPLVLADIGATLHHQLAWSGAGLLRSCAPCAPCWKPHPFSLRRTTSVQLNLSNE